MSGRRDDPRPPRLPRELAELDRELSAIVIDERPSFGPELRAELEKACAGPSPSFRFRLPPRWAAAVGAALLVAAATPQARAGLARLLPWAGPDARVAPERSVPPSDQVLADEELPEDATDGPIESEAAVARPLAESRGELPRPEHTYPTLLDRSEAQRTIRRSYPQALQDVGIGGVVKLRMWVESDGTVDHVQIERGSGLSELDRVAVEVAPGLRFEPARRSGVPVGTWVSFDVVFEASSEDEPRPSPPSPIASPAPPQNLGYELPDDLLSGEYMTPPPTLFEGQQMLRDALDGSVDEGGPLGGLAALLSGDPPPGVGPTTWRREAGVMLEDAMRRAPDNPAPALALARIRRKQGLREEARQLYGDATWRARASRASVSPAFLAELYYEQATLVQEQWLAWEGLGRIATTRLGAIECRGISGGDPGRLASAQRLIGLNNLCPDGFRRLRAEAFEAIGPSKGESRDDVLRFLEAAAEAVPSHAGANVEILLDLADQGRWADLLKRSQRFIWESQGHPHGILLSALALQRLGYPEEAMERFRAGFEAVAEAEARRYTDIGVLLPPAREVAYRAMSEDERGDVEEVFWHGRDPILITSVNERVVEHFARAVYATLRFGQQSPDAVEVLLRYGHPSSAWAVGEGRGMRTVFWDYGAGSHVTFRSPATSRRMQLTPESASYLRSLKEIVPERYGTGALREVRDLAGLLSRFRAADGELEIEVHSAVPDEMYGGPSDSLHVAIYVLDERGDALSSSRGRVPAAPGALDMSIGADEAGRQVVLEVYDDRVGYLSALREPVGRTTPAGEGAHVSDLLLVEAANPEPEEVRRGAPWVLPLVEAVGEDATVGVLFELYDLPDSAATYGLAAHLERADGSRVPLYSCPVGAHEFRTTWRRRATAGTGVTEYVTLDVSEVPAAEYTLVLTVTVAGLADGTSARRSLTIL